MARNDAKCSQKPPKRQLYKSDAVCNRVVARYMAGQSYRQIAAEENIDRATVTRILAESDAVHMVARYQSRLLQILPKAVLVIEKALDSPDHRVSTQAAFKVVASTNTLYSSGVGMTISEVERNSKVFEIKEKQKLNKEDMAALGHFTELVWKAHSQDQGPLAPGWEWLEEATEPKVVDEATGGGPPDDSADRADVWEAKSGTEHVERVSRPKLRKISSLFGDLKSPSADGLKPC